MIKVVPTVKSATELVQYVGFYLYCKNKVMLAKHLVTTNPYYENFMNAGLGMELIAT